MGKLDGKVAIVTGSGRGIGRAIALKLAGDGADLVINDLDETPAQETAQEIRALGRKAAVCAGDVTAPDFGERVVKTAMDTFGNLHIIVNNAGFPWDAVIQKMTDEQFQTMLNVHAMAPFRILRAAAEPIRALAKAEKEAGKSLTRKVVNISSIAGLYGNPGQIAYSAGKMAVVGMTRTLAKEWGRYNVTVNCVAFGLIGTRMTKAKGTGDEVANIGGRDIAMGMPQEAIDGISRMIPLGRPGTPDDAAGAAYLFCIPESDYISGQVVLASGGLIA